MAELRVSELPTAVTLDDSDLLLLSQPDANSDTGYASAKTTNAALATKVVKQTNFSELQTTSKNVIGAINEISGAASSLVDLDDVDITTPSDGECLQYNGTSQKWENKDILAVNETTLTEPYVYKQVPNGKYTEKLKKLIGASVVWNQLVSTFTTRSSNGVDATIDSNHVITFSGKGTASWAITFIGSANNVVLQNNHVYFATFGELTADDNAYVLLKDNDNNIIYRYQNIKNSYVKAYFFKATNTGKCIFSVTGGVDVSPSGTIVPLLVDLTAMLGSTIADYVMSLDTMNRRIAWLKSYGFFTEDYYAYSANTIQSVSVSKHITKDSESQTLTETNLDHTTLRGLFKLDSNNNLYADGDIYNSDGSEDVNYEERAYASGDESLPDTITDGTTTVTKKATPTTATLTPFNSVSEIEQGGTEEFIDYGVEQSTRDVAIPCGNESVYGDNRLMGEIIKYINN